MITLHEARPWAGKNRKVVYRAHESAPIEEGVITKVTEYYVFVRFGADVHAKATRPYDLNWLDDSTPGPLFPQEEL